MLLLHLDAVSSFNLRRSHSYRQVHPSHVKKTNTHTLVHIVLRRRSLGYKLKHMSGSGIPDGFESAQTTFHCSHEEFCFFLHRKRCALGQVLLKLKVIGLHQTEKPEVFHSLSALQCVINVEAKLKCCHLIFMKNGICHFVIF